MNQADLADKSRDLAKELTTPGPRRRCLSGRRGARSRRALAACGLALCLGLAAACSKQESVATVPTENEAIEIVNTLNEKGIEAAKEEVGEEGSKQWRVSVTEDAFSDGKLALALQALQDSGLPRPNDKGMEGAYEEKGMFPSESAQKAQRLKELKTEVERQLRLLPAVVRVSINIVLPEDDTINLNPYPATASVLIIHRDEKPSFTAAYVQDLVAKGVPKLKPENVGVVLINEPPRALVMGPVAARRRMNTIYAIGAGLGVLLTLMLVTVVLQVRRQRRRSQSGSRTDERAAANAAAPGPAATSTGPAAAVPAAAAGSTPAPQPTTPPQIGAGARPAGQARQ
jgi:type III secretory pathway lipoprotein EscJ